MFDFENTKRLKISDVCNLITDGNWIESKDQSDAGIRLIQTGNVGNGEYVNKIDHARYISADTFNQLKCTEIFPGDILISRLPDPIGRACILPDIGKRMITAVDCTIIRVNNTLINNDFFIAYTKSQDYNNKIAESSRGATRQRISRNDLENIPIPLPPLSLQNRFAAFVEQADKSKFELQKTLDSLEATYKSLIKENLG
jgi:type I restriction enzyme S subunit